MYLYSHLTIGSTYYTEKNWQVELQWFSALTAHLLFGFALQDRGQTRSRRSIWLLLQDQRSPNPQHLETHPLSWTVPGDTAKKNNLIQCVHHQAIVHYSAATYIGPNHAQQNKSLYIKASPWCCLWRCQPVHSPHPEQLSVRLQRKRCRPLIGAALLEWPPGQSPLYLPHAGPAWLPAAWLHGKRMWKDTLEQHAMSKKVQYR